MNQPGTPQVMPFDDDGVTTEPAESEYFSDAESEFADLQEKADRQTAALQTILDTTQNESATRLRGC